MSHREAALGAARAYALTAAEDGRRTVEALVLLGWAALSEAALAASDVGDRGEGSELLGLAEAVFLHWFRGAQAGAPLPGEGRRAAALINEIEFRMQMRGADK